MLSNSMPPMVRPVDIGTDGAGNTVTAAPKKHGALFEQLNCGKLGLSIDMKSEKVGWVFFASFLKTYRASKPYMCCTFAVLCECVCEFYFTRSPNNTHYYLTNIYIHAYILSYIYCIHYIYIFAYIYTFMHLCDCRAWSF